MNIKDIIHFSQILHQNTFFKILELIFDKLEMLGAIFIKMNKSWLGKNLDLVVLYNII